MTTKPTGRKPPTHSPTVEALLAEERILEPQPSDLRERLLLRARRAQHIAPLAEPPSALPRRYGKGTIAAAGLALVAAVSAALLLSRSKAPTSLSVPTSKSPAHAPLSAPSAPMVLPPVSTASPAPAAATELPDSSSHGSANPEPSVANHRAPQSKHDALSAELLLLSRARQADARGDFTGVLTTLAEHERSYPAGRLSEEREVLRVKALVALGRIDEARRAGARFARRFPRSVLVPKVNEMLGSPP